MTTATPTTPKCPFELPVRIERHPSQDIAFIEDATGLIVGSTTNHRRSNEIAAYVAHAVNQHATLTAENAKFRAALEAIASTRATGGDVVGLGERFISGYVAGVDHVSSLARTALSGGEA